MKRSGQYKLLFLGALLIILGIAAAIFFAKQLFKSEPSKQTVKDVYPDEVTYGQATGENGASVNKKIAQSKSPASQPTAQITTPIDSLSPVHGVGNESDLVDVPSRYTSKDEKIHKNTYNPLIAMITAAEKDGISLSVVSAYRSYKRQKQIWENKWGDVPDDDQKKALSILRWSSFPGISRHHWGTEVDFNSVQLSYWESPEGKVVHQWLTKNAPAFGFCQVYGPGRDKGYSEEPWHWSHISTANTYYDQIRQPAVLDIALSQSVKGGQAVQSLGTAMDYVTHISPCHR